MNTPDVGTQQQDGCKLRRDELMAKIDAVQALPSLRAPLLDDCALR